MSDEREPIIDAMLEEVLGNQQPPDLTQRILGAHDAATDSSIDVSRMRQGSAGNGVSNGHSKSTKPSVLKSAKVSAKSPSLDDLSPRIETQPLRTANARSTWQTWASVAVVLIGFGGFLYWANVSQQEHFAGINGPSTTKNLPPKETGLANIPTQPPKDSVEESTHQEQDNQPSPIVDEPATQFADSSNNSIDQVVEVTPELTPPVVDPLASPTFQRELELSGALQSDARMIATIDDQLQKKWKKVSLKPLPLVNDRTWFLRATNFLLGRQPRDEELRQFARSLDREAFVDRMLRSREFARRWGAFYVRVLIGSTSDSNPVDEGELEEFLASSIQEGKPYDQLAFELITAAGANRPSEPEFNPATNFLLAHQQYEWIPGKKKSENYKIQATEKVSQVFLGKQLQCARCHEHQGTTQDQYYQMVSFFTQLRPINGRPGEPSKLMNADYRGASGRNADEADVFFTRRDLNGEASDGTGVSVYPQFLDGRKVDTPSGRIADINRREAFAKYVVSSEDFPRAFVNRIWDEALGFGFTNPIEDMGDHNPPSHPELLQSLADQFKNSGFDIKPTMKWIALSQAFNRRSRANTDLLVRRPDLFSSFARTDRDLFYQTVSGAMKESARALQAGVVPDAHAQIGMEEKEKMSAAQRSRLQASLNAKNELLKKRYGTLISTLARNENLTDLDLIKHVFLFTVGRLPVEYERKRGYEILEAKRDRESALLEIGVLLLNSREFGTQH